MAEQNKVNYDEIAAEYDQRYQEERRQGTHEALRTLLSDECPRRVLEIGCGTCHWLEGLGAINRSTTLIGVDLSFEMLKHAENAEGLFLSQGKAEVLPFISESMDLIYCVNALHHFGDKRVFIHEAFRLLTPGGVLAIIGMDPSDDRNEWYIYDFFDGTFSRDLQRFPTWTQVELWLRNTGFTDLHRKDVAFIDDPKSHRTVLRDPFLKKNACSQLALLSQSEYQRGLIKIRRNIERMGKNNPKVYPNKIILSMQVARKATG